MEQTNKLILTKYKSLTPWLNMCFEQLCAHDRQDNISCTLIKNITILYWSQQISPHFPETHFHWDIAASVSETFALFVTHVGPGQWVKPGPALSKSPCGDNRYIRLWWIPSKDLFPVTTHCAGNMFSGILDFPFLSIFPVRASWLWKAFSWYPCTVFIVTLETHNSCICWIYYLFVFKPLRCEHFRPCETNDCKHAPNFQLVWLRKQCSLGTSILDLFNGWVLVRTRRTNWKVFSR